MEEAWNVEVWVINNNSNGIPSASVTLDFDQLESSIGNPTNDLGTVLFPDLKVKDTIALDKAHTLLLRLIARTMEFRIPPMFPYHKTEQFGVTYLYPIKLRSLTGTLQPIRRSILLKVRFSSMPQGHGI